VTVGYVDAKRVVDALDEVLGMAVTKQYVGGKPQWECQYCGESLSSHFEQIEVEHADECPVPTLTVLQMQLLGAPK
jgi:hypothetical protein